MTYPKDFTFASIKTQFDLALQNGYTIVRCEDYIRYKERKQNYKVLINRVDIDGSCKKAARLARIFNELKIPASFFVRLHADEYNPFSFENYKCLKFIKESGHEIGYHSEIIDQSSIWNEEPSKCLIKDISVLNNMFDIKVKGVASHGGITRLNNLDFWKDRKPFEFNLLYEAYDTQPEFGLFYNSLYISDSNYKWKCYRNGEKLEGVQKNIAEHSLEGHQILYTTIHPETYYDTHIYE